ncbi:MAG: radical SAM protein [Burkholderiaceae bacterium]|nr:radical SAM protein [Burkholderiaceae bacterium]
MSVAARAEEGLLHRTTSLCRVCKGAVDAEVVAGADGDVWLHKTCAEHGAQAVRIAADADWYMRTRAVPTPAAPPPDRRPAQHGCPFDCGPCTSHSQAVKLPVVTITSACNLDCPICYVHNKNDDAFHMSDAEFEQVLAALVRSHGGDLDLINLTGGEPTLHPRFEHFIALARAAGVHRVSICTHGIALARDEALVARLAALEARVALSFDSFEREADFALQGARLVDLKRRCLDALERHGVDTTLIPVMTRGYNDHEIGAIIAEGLRRTNVRHIEVHLMTYTGQSGASFDRSGRITLDEVLDRVEETTAGLLRRADFVSSPCAHPLCYQIAYLLLDPEGGPPVPFGRFFTRDEMYACLADHLYLEPSPALERAFVDAINRLWLEDDAESARALHIIKALLGRLFPTDRALSRAEALRVSERAVKAVYVHAHMDEETFDVERVAQCCDSNCYADGRTVPVCSYNVLYREKEPRFMSEPKAWGARVGSARPLVYIGEPGAR